MTRMEKEIKKRRLFVQDFIIILILSMVSGVLYIKNIPFFNFFIVLIGCCCMFEVLKGKDIEEDSIGVRIVFYSAIGAFIKLLFLI